jgi:hypothetical protein
LTGTADWASVSRDVGSKTRSQCSDKVRTEVAAGRMQKPGDMRVSTSAASDDMSDDDSTSAAPPLLSVGETTAGTTLPSVSFPPSVGSKAREQRVSDVTAKVGAGRMQKPGGKRVSWSKTELLKLIKLMQAVGRHSRDWAAVSREVGSKTKPQCFNKVKNEVAAGRMQEPPSKH